jgi:ribosome assembly protein YihI (activator of Der GTPase)
MVEKKMKQRKLKSKKRHSTKKQKKSRIRPGKQSSTQSASSSPQTGDGNDPLVKLMRRFGIPLTLENYRNLNHMGQPPEEIGPEEEIPPEIKSR